MLSLPTEEQGMYIRTLYASDKVSNPANHYGGNKTMKHLFVVSNLIDRHLFFNIDVGGVTTQVGTFEKAIELFNEI